MADNSELINRLNAMAGFAVGTTIASVGLLGLIADDPIKVESAFQRELLKSVDTYAAGKLDGDLAVARNLELMMGISYCVEWYNLLLELGLTEDLAEGSLFNVFWFEDYTEYLSNPSAYRKKEPDFEIGRSTADRYGIVFINMLQKVYKFDDDLIRTIII